MATTKNENKSITFKERCAIANVNYPNALYQRKKHPSLSDDEVISICCKAKNSTEMTEEEKERYYTDKKKPFMVKCEEENLDYAMAYMYLRRHPDMTEDEVITYYKLKSQFKHVTAQTARGFLELKEQYPTLSDQELIAYYNVKTLHPTFIEDDIKKYYEIKGMNPDMTDRDIIVQMKDKQ